MDKLQNQGTRKKKYPPDLPGLDNSISPEDTVSDISSIVDVVDMIYLNKYKILASDAILCASDSDNSPTKSDDVNVLKNQDLNKATTSSGKNTNTITSFDGVFNIEYNAMKDQGGNTELDANIKPLRMMPKSVDYCELSEDDGDFSGTDDSDYVSNSAEKPRLLKKISTEHVKARVNLNDRISRALLETDLQKASTSNPQKDYYFVPESPESAPSFMSAKVVKETPESSFESKENLKPEPRILACNKIIKKYTSINLNEESCQISEEQTNVASQIGQVMPCDVYDFDGEVIEVNQNIEDLDLSQTNQTTTGKKRTWNRRNCCFYCESLVTNFTRHLKRNHSDEVEVMKLMAITDPDPKVQKMKRQAITDSLRNRGNFIHNTNVVANNEGNLISIRRPTDTNKQPQSPSAFVICKHCLGTFKRSTFYRHSKKCVGNDGDSNYSLSKNAMCIIPNLENASIELAKNVLPRLRNDDISLIVKNDPLIISYGSRLLKKKKERRSRKVICSRMRDLAHLLKILREKNSEITQLEHMFEPKHYEIFVEAIKTMSGFDEETGFVNVPSIPARIRPQILGCIEILFTKTIMDNTKSTALKKFTKNKLSDFKLLLEANWQWEISSNAEKTRKLKLMTKSQVMPLDGDIVKLMEKIHELEDKYYINLKKEVTVVNYENLCEVTIAHIILLDRKRSGDVAESELQYYLNRKVDEIPPQVLETLDLKQQQAISELDIFQIPGKRGRPVPVLLTKTMRKNIDLLIASRTTLKISSNNKLLFARPLTEEPFDGGKCLNNIKNMCSLAKPEMLTSTGLRHHIATISQVHAKTDDKYTQHLAAFLGHDMQVHASNYRLPLQAIQKGLVGSRLLEVEQLSDKRNENKQDSEVEIDEENTGNGLNKIHIEDGKSGEKIDKITESSNIKTTKNSIPNDSEDKLKKTKTIRKSSQRMKKNINRISDYDDNNDESNNNDIKKTSPIKTITKRSQKQKHRKNKMSEDDDDDDEKFNEENNDIKKTRQLKTITKPSHKKKTTINKSSDDGEYSSDENYDESDEDIRTKPPKKRRKKTHKTWSAEEKSAVMRHLGKFIKMKKNPGKSNCEEVLRKEHVLRNRTWMQINTYINNIYKKK